MIAREPKAKQTRFPFVGIPVRMSCAILLGWLFSVGMYWAVEQSISNISGLSPGLHRHLLSWELLLVSAALGALGLLGSLLGPAVLFLLLLGFLSGYLFDFFSLASIGQFTGLEGLRLWWENPTQVLQHAAHFEPMMVVMLPLAVIVSASVFSTVIYRSGRAPWKVGLPIVFVVLVGLGVIGYYIEASSFSSLIVRDDYLKRQGGTIHSLKSLSENLRDSKSGPLLRVFADIRLRLEGDVLPTIPPSEIRREAILQDDAYRATIDGRRRPNVVLIVVESLRPDELESFVGPRSVMPAVDDIARRGARFLDTYAQASHSNYSDPCILSGQYPLRSRAVYSYPKEFHYPKPLVYDLLKLAGYRTAIISSQNENWGGMANFLQSQNLDLFLHAENFSGDTYVPRGDTGFAKFVKGQKRAGKIDDRLTVDELIKWTGADTQTPFFVYTNLQNSHIPYEIPADHPMKFGERELPFTLRFGEFPRDQIAAVKNRYSDSLAYVDSQIRRLVEALTRSGQIENTVFVVTGDTGQAFFEHGFAGHANELYDELVRVPLIFSGWSVPKLASNISAQHIDIAPTILGLAGLPAHPAFQGIDLFSAVTANRPRFLVVQTPLAYQYGIVRSGWKLLYDARTKTEKLFDLGSDPGEMENLIDTEADRAGRLRRTLDLWRAAQLDYYSSVALGATTYPPELVDVQ